MIRQLMPQKLLGLLILVLASSAARSQTTQEAKFLGKDPFYWIDQLGSPTPRERRAAAFALGKLGAEAHSHFGVPKLVVRLGDQESAPEVRDAAAYALGEIGLDLRQYVAKYSHDAWAAANGSLLHALREDKDPRVRRSAAYGIGGFGKTAASARKQLQTALQDESPGVRQNAAWALGQLGTEQAADTLQALSKAFGDSDALVRRDAAAAVGEIGRLRGRNDELLPNPAVAPLLQMFHTEKDATIRKVAIDALVNAVTAQDKGAAGGLRQLLEDKDPEIARGAALALGNIGGTEANQAVRVLRDALRKGDPLSRIQASAALANIGEGASIIVGDLIAALDDKEPQIRRNIALGLRNIGEKASAAVPALAKHIRSDETHEEVRAYSAEALAQMPSEHLTKVIPDLLKAIKEDKAASVRQRCVWALFNLRDLHAEGVIEALTALLDEREDAQVLVRYDAARCLGLRLESKAPPKAVDVLLDMLNDKRLRIYEGSGADVTGSSVEGAKGGATVAQNLGGDARFLAAQALARIGAKANRPEVIKALNEAAKSSNKQIASEAKKALDAIRGKK
jgi:HEAT repeat protein